MEDDGLGRCLARLVVGVVVGVTNDACTIQDEGAGAGIQLVNALGQMGVGVRQQVGMFEVQAVPSGKGLRGGSRAREDDEGAGGRWEVRTALGLSPGTGDIGAPGAAAEEEQGDRLASQGGQRERLALSVGQGEGWGRAGRPGARRERDSRAEGVAAGGGTAGEGAAAAVIGIVLQGPGDFQKQAGV